MTDERIHNTIGECAIGLTQHIMSRDAVSHDVAYCKLLGSELFKLINDPDTRLYLEPNSELARLYDIERQFGTDALYNAIA